MRLNDRKTRHRRKLEPVITSLTEYGTVSLGAKMAGTSHLMSAQLGFLSEDGRDEPFDERSARKVRFQPRTPQLPGNPGNLGKPENSRAQRTDCARPISSWITGLTEFGSVSSTNHRSHHGSQG